MQGVFKVVHSEFSGQAPEWYKLTIVGFLIINPLLLQVAGPYIAGWVLVLQFIFTSYGLEVLSAAAWRLTGFRRHRAWHDQSDYRITPSRSSLSSDSAVDLHGCWHLFYERIAALYFHQDPALSTIQNPAFILILCNFRSALGLLRHDRYGSGN